MPTIKILLIEDDEDDYILTRSVLEDSRPLKYNLTWLTDYEAGLAAVQRLEHDICLLDYRLGARTGLDFLRETSARESDLPIIVLTGLGDQAIDMEVMDAGASDYLVKNELTPTILERALRYALQQKRIALQRVRLAREAEARRAAEAANHAKDEFIAMISHELRTPLNAVLGWVKLLRSGRLDEEKRERALATIERSAYSQSQLIEDLLDFSRIISGKFHLDLTKVNPAAIIQNALATIQPAAEAKQITLYADLAENIEVISADANRLTQAFVNLLGNAVKFTPEKGTVTITLADHDAGHIAITVSDTGEGIAPDFLPYIFERYRQAGDSTRQRGLGLGLPIVRQIVDFHGGQVTASSPGPGQGATFTVVLSK